MEGFIKKQTLPQQVAGYLREQFLQNAEPGVALPPVREMARKLGVSVPTVCAAAALLEQEGLVEKRQGSGIYVAEQRPWRIGILSELDPFDPRIGAYFRMTVGEVRRCLEANGCEPVIYTGSARGGLHVSNTPTCRWFWDDAAAGLLDGAVIIDVPSTEVWRRRVLGSAIPLVGAHTGFEANIDMSGILVASVRRLAEQGCGRLGLIAWSQDEAFRQAVSDNGVETRDGWIRTDLDPILRGAGWDEFREIWMASDDRPDGLVILDDMLFADAQLAMLELGVRVPADLRLAIQTTRGGTPPPRLPATVFELDPAETAKSYTDMILARLRGEPSTPLVRLLPYLEREWTAESPDREELCGA